MSIQIPKEGIREILKVCEWSEVVYGEDKTSIIFKNISEGLGGKPLTGEAVYKPIMHYLLRNLSHKMSTRFGESVTFGGCEIGDTPYLQYKGAKITSYEILEDFYNYQNKVPIYGIQN